MNKNDIFTFTAHNGVEVTAVVIAEVANEIPILTHITRYLCYAQNRLFTYEESYSIMHTELPHEFKYGEVIVDYAVLPDYDAMLENYQHQLDMADDYASREY